MAEDLSRFCFQNEHCPDYGQRGLGNLLILLECRFAVSEAHQ